MSGGNSGSSGQQAQKAKRNPVERALVWGFIAVMLVVVANEGYARLAYSHAQSTLARKLALVDEKPDAPAVTEADVKEAMWGKQPTREEDLSKKFVSNGASRMEEYNWFTLRPSKYRMFVYYGHKAKDATGPAEVLSVGSEEEKLIEFRKATQEEIQEMLKQAANAPQFGPTMQNFGPAGRGGRPPGAEGDTSAGASGSDGQPAGEKQTGDTPAEETSGEEKSDDAGSE